MGIIYADIGAYYDPNKEIKRKTLEFLRFYM